MLSIFVILFFFGPGSVSFVVFFRSSFLRVAVCRNFRERTFFSGLGIGRVCFGIVLPMFLLYYLVFRPRKGSEKILFWSGPFF